MSVCLSVGGLSDAQCDGGVCTSPAAVSNPEYFDDDLIAACGDDQTTLEAHPMRLRIQSTESTASDHDEYDRLNCSSQTAAAAPRSAHDVRLKAKGMIDVATAHQVFAESVL